MKHKTLPGCPNDRNCVMPGPHVGGHLYSTFSDSEVCPEEHPKERNAELAAFAGALTGSLVSGLLVIWITKRLER